MIVKLVTVFLLVMAVLGVFGKLRIPKLRDQVKRLSTKKCKSCGRYRIGRGPCECGHT